MYCSAATTDNYAYFPHYHGEKEFDQYGIRNKNIEIHWCPGNHENWDVLDTFKDKHQIQPKIYYRDFGSILKLPDDRIVMFCGGAVSIDKEYRILGQTWWNQETISEKDMYKLPDIKVDIIISHTVPNCWLDSVTTNTDFEYYDPSTTALETIFDIYKPKLWYSGHFHKYANGVYKNCKWFCLDMVDNNKKWYKELY